MESFKMSSGENEVVNTCASCRFQYLEAMQGMIQRVMVCHRRPPGVFLMQTARGIQGVTQFPIVQPAMFCHDFERVSASLEPANSLEIQCDVPIPDGT
jgi:hypothetical protein